MAIIPIAIPYSDVVDTDTTEECAFVHRLLLAWAAWIYGAGKLGCGTYADVLGLPASELDGHPDLTEDQLLAIDYAIAQLPGRMRRLVFVHYASSEDEPMTSRYKRLNCTRLEYRTRMTALHSAIYARLMPVIEQWRHSVL